MRSISRSCRARPLNRKTRCKYQVSVSVDGEDSTLESLLSSASVLISQSGQGAADGPALLARARGDVERLIAALYSEARYGGEVEIRIGGVPLEQVRPEDLLSAAGGTPVAVSLHVTPGPGFRFGSIDIGQTTPTEIEPPTRPEDYALVAGEPAKAEIITTAIDKLVEAWRASGYPFAQIAKKEIVADHARSRRRCPPDGRAGLARRLWLDQRHGRFDPGDGQHHPAKRVGARAPLQHRRPEADARAPAQVRQHRKRAHHRGRRRRRRRRHSHHRRGDGAQAALLRRDRLRIDRRRRRGSGLLGPSQSVRRGRAPEARRNGLSDRRRGARAAAVRRRRGPHQAGRPRHRYRLLQRASHRSRAPRHLREPRRQGPGRPGAPLRSVSFRLARARRLAVAHRGCVRR